MKDSMVKVKFQVVDNHPGVGHKRGVVHEETLEFKCNEGNFAIIPDAGKYYVKLMEQFNGKHTSLLRSRYDVNYHIV